MSSGDLLSSTLNWPGRGFYGLKSSFLQTTESDRVKQTIVCDHMRNHFRRLNNARSAIDSKPPKSMVLGQKCRDRARKEMAQMAYTQNVLDQVSSENFRNTTRGRSNQSARSHGTIQSQPTTYRARSRSVETSRLVTRSLTMDGSMQNLHRNAPSNDTIVNKLFGDGAISQALVSMTALSKMTSTARNKSSADVLDKHSKSFSQPNPEEHQPRLVKRDGASYLRDNHKYYNPPRKAKTQARSSAKQQSNLQENIVDDNKQIEDEQLALREQLNKSLELRQSVEKKIKKAKATREAEPVIRKQFNATLKRFGLPEHERLQYARFMQEITNAIIQKNLITEHAIEKLFELHIDRSGGKLDQDRLRDLLEALKEDLGVQSSRKPDSYLSVDKVTTYDNEPLAPQTPATTQEDALFLTPKTPSNGRRRSSFDIDTPLPWQSDNDTDTQRTITQYAIHESQSKILNDNNANNIQDPLNVDGQLPPTSTTIKPKPRLSLQTKVEDQYQPTNAPNTLMTEHEPMDPISINAPMRQPMTEPHIYGWNVDLQPTERKVEIYPSNDVKEYHPEKEEHTTDDDNDNDDGDGDDDRQNTSHQSHDHPGWNEYDTHDFENDNSET